MERSTGVFILVICCVLVVHLPDFWDWAYDEGGTDFFRWNRDQIVIGKAIHEPADSTAVTAVIPIQNPPEQAYFVSGDHACTSQNLHCSRVQYKRWYAYFWKQSRFDCASTELLSDVMYQAICS